MTDPTTDQDTTPPVGLGRADETTAEQDRRQIEVFTARQDRDRALGLTREVLAAVLKPGTAIPTRRLRDWSTRLDQLERAAGQR